MAKSGLVLEGTGEFQMALRRLAELYPTRLGRGLIRAGLLVKRESQKIVPVDKNILKPSAYCKHEGKGKLMVVKIGYKASYGIFVHEMVELKHKPGKSAKFLSRALREHVPEMIKIIEREIDIHGKI